MPWKWPVCLPFWVGLEKANKKTNKPNKKPTPPPAKLGQYTILTKPRSFQTRKTSVKMCVGGRLCPKRTSSLCPPRGQKELEITILSSPRVKSASFEDVFKLMGRVQRLWGGQAILWSNRPDPHSPGALAQLTSLPGLPWKPSRLYEDPGRHTSCKTSWL